MIQDQDPHQEATGAPAEAARRHADLGSSWAIGAGAGCILIFALFASPPFAAVVAGVTTLLLWRAGGLVAGLAGMLVSIGVFVLAAFSRLDCAGTGCSNETQAVVRVGAAALVAGAAISVVLARRRRRPSP